MITLDEWSKLSEAAPTMILSRIIVNTMPITIKDDILFLIYIGPADKKESFNTHYTKEKFRLLDFISKTYSVKHIKPVKSINKEELEWILDYATKFNASKISWIF